jgi:hypothetical protein
MIEHLKSNNRAANSSSLQKSVVLVSLAWFSSTWPITSALLDALCVRYQKRHGGRKTIEYFFQLLGPPIEVNTGYPTGV